ncbi:MAG: hypothetical protein WBM54_15235 [Woeseia sp.]
MQLSDQTGRRGCQNELIPQQRTQFQRSPPQRSRPFADLREMLANPACMRPLLRAQPGAGDGHFVPGCCSPGPAALRNPEVAREKSRFSNLSGNMRCDLARSRCA